MRSRVTVREEKTSTSCGGRTLVVGLTGGVASGKSTVAGMFAELGAQVIDADLIAHRVLERPEVIQRLRAEFGDCVFDADGRPDRKRLGEAVFGDPEALRRLAAIVHPRIIEEMRTMLNRALSDGVPVVVIDAPLLIEADLDDWCDVLVFVDCDATRRIERAVSRGWDADELRRREAAQRPLEEKRRRAHVVIDNNGAFDETRKQVRAVYAEWAKARSFI